MKISTKKILGIFSFSLLLMLLTSFVFDIFKIKEYGYVIILFISYLVSIFLLGKANRRNSNEKLIFLAIIVFTILYQILTFVLFGLTAGFLSSSYKYGFSHLFKIALPITLIIIFSELLRYQFIEKGRSSNLIITSTIVYFVIVDFLINSGLYNLNVFKGWFEIASFVIFPSFIKNILFTYISYHYSYKSNIGYRVIMELPIYFLPIVPDINNYLQCVLLIIFPFAFLLFIISYTEAVAIKRKRVEMKQDNKITRISSAILMTILLIFTFLMSGLFKYYFLVVGSGSMKPKINYGDMVLIEKVKDVEKLKLGEVLVFKYGKKVVLHRIVALNDDGGQIVFKTKGDNNETVDSWEIYENDVIGKVKFKISKIGYPSVWLNELLKKGGN